MVDALKKPAFEGLRGIALDAVSLKQSLSITEALKPPLSITEALKKPLEARGILAEAASGLGVRDVKEELMASIGALRGADKRALLDLPHSPDHSSEIAEHLELGAFQPSRHLLSERDVKVIEALTSSIDRLAEAIERFNAR